MINLNILITDDNFFIRDGIKLSLKRGKWTTSIDEAENGLKAFELATQNDYDIILMDISMPIMGGKESLSKILEQNPKQKILVISMHSSKDEIETLKNIGAKGYMLKDDVGKSLVEVIERVLADDLVFDLVYY